MRRHDVEHTFGQSIPSAFHLAAARAGIRQIAYREENAGGAMADGYARISGKVAVVTAQNGPAAALLVAPLMEALKASVPLVALVQDVETDAVDRNAFQEMDHRAVLGPCTKWVGRIDDPARVDDLVDLAFATAASGRAGPVALLVPEDVLEEESPGEPDRTAELGYFPLDRQLPEQSRLEEAAVRLSTAEAPLVIAGGGVHLSGASAALARLQEACHLPVGTTTMGKGAVDEEHRLSLGVIGDLMDEGSRTHSFRELIGESDVVLLVGTRTNQNGTAHWGLFPEAADFIHIDVDGSEVGRNYDSLRLVADARMTLEALTDRLLEIDLTSLASRRPELERRIEEGHAAFGRATSEVIASESHPIRPERLMREIDARLTPETIVTADASYAPVWMANYLIARAPGSRFVCGRGLAGLGWGMPLAMGAKLAAPDRPVICLTGDGGFGHCWAELETAVRCDVPVVTVVLNNQVLAYTRDDEEASFGDHTSACDLGFVDHAAIARACGAVGITVQEPEDIGGAMDQALASGSPTLIDAIVDPHARPPVNMLEGKLPAFAGA
jgi:acetolactate synthase-1/2/3 large subunit